MKYFKQILVLSCFLFVGSVGMNAEARRIGYLQAFVVYYETTTVGEKYTEYLPKAVTNRDAVINLQNTASGKTITVIMRNTNGDARGSTVVNTGNRKEFASTGQAYYSYRLGLRKTYNTDGISATLYGSWSPDKS